MEKTRKNLVEKLNKKNEKAKNDRNDCSTHIPTNCSKKKQMLWIYVMCDNCKKFRYLKDSTTDSLHLSVLHESIYVKVAKLSNL